MRALAAVLTTAALVTTAAACTLHPEDEEPIEPESSATLAQTQQRLVAVARSALIEAVGPGASLVTGRGGTPNPITAHCSRFSSPPPGSPVNSTYYFEVRGADLMRVPDYFARFVDRLRSLGWHQDDRGSDTVAMHLRHYTISMTYAASTRYLSLSGSTPCVKLR